MSGSKTDWLLSAPTAASNPRAETPLYPFLAKLLRGEDLSGREAASFYTAITDPKTGSNQIAAALTALTIKGETFEELAGMALVMREQATHIRALQKNAVDITGTGSSTAKTFNVSTAAAFVAAGAGLMIAKQSNRGVATRIGSADVLTELGVKVASEPSVAQTSLNGVAISFLFAPKFHTALKRVAEVRRSLGIRTCLNLLGVLANPAGVNRSLIGVWHQSMVEPAAKALALLKTDKSWVVYGSDGLDEITLAGPTLVAETIARQTRGFQIAPKDFGLKPAPIDHLRAKSAKESAKIIREVLSSKRRDEARSLVVMNAAAALIVGGFSKEPMHAARLAEQSIDSGQAQNKLDRLVQLTNKISKNVSPGKN